MAHWYLWCERRDREEGLTAHGRRAARKSSFGRELLTIVAQRLVHGRG